MVTLDERVSRLEGITEQINERLGNLEHGLDSLRQEVRQGQDSLRQEMRQGQESLRGEMQQMRESLRSESRQSEYALRSDMKTQFHWMMGTFLGVAVAILGVMVAGFWAMQG